MKKRLKGFTLIECLVAMAVLGIACGTMGVIYAGVSSRTRANHLVNTSLSNQMAYVEKYTGTSDVVELKYSGATSGTPPTSSYYIQIERENDDGTLSGEKYSYPIDIYVLNSLDSSGNKAADEGDYDLRYKYFQGHS